MNRITINGVTITGNNVSVVNGRVIVDGKDVNCEEKVINIHVEGNLGSLTADACSTITVNGSAGSVKTRSGDVQCGDVSGAVSTMSGDVTCGNIAGSVSTMSGDVSHR